jgi:tRNA-splicing ligase RtcB
MKLKISAKELRAIGYPESPVIPVAMNVMENILNITQKKKHLKY